jgi:hypothetical protein
MGRVRCAVPLTARVALAVEITAVSKFGARFISVNSRLSVSGRWLSQGSARWVNPSTDGKRFDFENLAVSPCDEYVLVLEMHSATL